MDSSRRLIRTLTGLVVAMTSTAALLAWVNPASSVASSQPPLEDLRELARSAVIEGVDALSQHWRDVSIRCTPETGSWLLTAAPAESCHFLVDAAGRATRTHQWRREQVDRSAPPTIRIQVRTSGEHPELSVAQEAAVDAILNTLEESRTAGVAPLRVVHEPGSSTARGVAPILGQRS